MVPHEWGTRRFVKQTKMLLNMEMKMQPKKQVICIFLMMLIVASTRTYAQTSEIENLFRHLESGAVSETPGGIDEAEPVLERLGRASKESVAGAIPVIVQATGDTHVAVRRVAALALYQISTRPDGQALLSTESATFAKLLTDPDIPIRRISGFAIANLRLDANSPLVPVLQSYLIRQDAVSTIGAGVATLLMQAAPNDADSTNTVVQFMRRKDQTSASRGVLLNAIMHVAKSHSREIGKEVAGYADDPDEQTSTLAIETLQSMGKDVVLDNQQSLSRIAADTGRTPSVRAAATKALSAVPQS
jgi:HEAT repeat protein